jgi:uncharacterized RDD family membrane protein YckC
MTADTQFPSPASQYARFSRRLRAMVIDWALLMAAFVAFLFLAITLGNENLTRPIAIAILLAALIYEPLLVSLNGATIGHYLANLRVIDERHGGNPGFGKAVARMVIKLALGVYSFATMLTTRRHQALHDIITNSTVRIRDASRAAEHHYVEERTELDSPGMPSRWRRALIILVYVVIAFAAFAATLPLLVSMGHMTLACLDYGRCTAREQIIHAALQAASLVVGALIIWAGWRGKLFGARRTS